jgi:hypothetical protein
MILLQNFIIACTALYNNRYAKKELLLFAYIFPHRLAITWNNSHLKLHQYATCYFAIIGLTYLLRNITYHGPQCIRTVISGEPPGELHGLVRSPKIRNLVSACEPSELNCTLPPDLTEKSLRFCYKLFMRIIRILKQPSIRISNCSTRRDQNITQVAGARDKCNATQEMFSSRVFRLVALRTRLL